MNWHNQLMFEPAAKARPKMCDESFINVTAVQKELKKKFTKGSKDTALLLAIVLDQKLKEHVMSEKKSKRINGLRLTKTH